LLHFVFPNYEFLSFLSTASSRRPSHEAAVIRCKKKKYIYIYYITVQETVNKPARTSGPEKYLFFIYGCTALVHVGHFFTFLFYTQSVGLLGRGISPSQGRYPHTEQHKHVHVYSEIRTNHLNVRAGEDGSCQRPRNHCDRHSCKVYRIYYIRVPIVLY
jgi:hypothetical protein